MTSVTNPARASPCTSSGTIGCAPEGTSGRDLRSSYITLRVYEGTPGTTISREAGTSVLMIERHYAGVIENWDGVRIPAEQQIRSARGRSMAVRREARAACARPESPAKRTRARRGT